MKLFSRRVSLIVTIAVLAVFISYFLLNAEDFQPLLHINLLLILGIAAADIASIGISGLFTKFILRPFNKRISLRESFFVSLISSIGNFFAPVGAGFGFRAVYLKKKYSLSYSDYISTLSGNYILVFLVNSFFGLLALYLLNKRQYSQFGVLVTVFATVFIFSLILSFIKIPELFTKSFNSKHLGSVLHNLSRITQGWNHIVSHKKLMLQLTTLTLLNLALTVLITLAIIKSLHLEITFAPLLLFSVLGSLSLFINITPANLGIKEAIYLFSSSILGFSTAQILSIALIDRSVLFLTLTLLWLTIPSIKKTVSKRISNSSTVLP